MRELKLLFNSICKKVLNKILLLTGRDLTKKTGDPLDRYTHQGDLVGGLKVLFSRCRMLVLQRGDNTF